MTKRDPRNFKTVDDFLDEDGIKDEVTKNAKRRVEQLREQDKEGK